MPEGANEASENRTGKAAVRGGLTGVALDRVVQYLIYGSAFNAILQTAILAQELPPKYLRLPDEVIVDFGIPNLNGADATRLILSEFTRVRIVALSAYFDRLHAHNIPELVKLAIIGGGTSLEQ